MSKQPSVSPFRFFTAFCLTIMAGVGSLAGCSASRADLRPYQYPLSPNARFYSYLMINGIVQGAFLTGEKSREELPAMEREDKKARLAVFSYMSHRKGQNAFQTDLALTHYLSQVRP